MNVFLFGAGASAFCGDSDHPPLGAKLFDKLRELGGAWSKLDESYECTFKDNFEVGMAEVLERERDLVLNGRLLNEMAGYLASFIPGPTNYYRRLINILRSRGRSVVFATLNYDLLIEQVLPNGVVYHSNDHKPGLLLLLKLHGSANFLPDIPVDQFQNLSAINVRRFGDADIRFATRQETIDYCKSAIVPPSMAMYEPRKQVLTTPKMVDHLQQGWSDLVDMAGAIFVIGCAVAEHDKHIWEPLGRSAAPLYVVDPSFAQYEKWALKRQRPNVSSLCSSFSECFDLVAENLA